MYNNGGEMTEAGRVKIRRGVFWTAKDDQKKSKKVLNGGCVLVKESGDKKCINYLIVTKT